MNDENIKYLMKGLEIAEACLDGCGRFHLEFSIFEPNLKLMDMLLAKDYLKFCFNGDAPDDAILIFHNSEDKYAHNGDVKIVCHLWQVPKVLEHVRKHKKVLAAIKEIKQRKEVKK